MSQPRAREVIAALRTAGPVLWLYGLAVWVSVLALLLTLLLDDPRTEPNTLLVFPGAVVVSSWSGGWGPGLLSTALTAVAAAYFSIPPAYSLVINSPSDVVRLIEYLAVSLLVV